MVQILLIYRIPKMNIEDQAKRDLIDQNSFEMAPIYDPYRHNNILKDSNKIQENNVRTTLKNFFQIKQKGQDQNKNNSQNNRHSLKRLLERLESLPSPDKKLTKLQNPKIKTLCAMSSTEPINIKKNNSIFARTLVEDKNSFLDKQKLNLKICTPASAHSSKMTGTKKEEEQIRIRNLIKKKLAQKQQLKYKNKTDKIINFLRENNCPSSIKKAKNTKQSSRKLINFLS